MHIFETGGRVSARERDGLTDVLSMSFPNLRVRAERNLIIGEHRLLFPRYTNGQWLPPKQALVARTPRTVYVKAFTVLPQYGIAIVPQEEQREIDITAFERAGLKPLTYSPVDEHGDYDEQDESLVLEHALNHNSHELQTRLAVFLSRITNVLEPSSLLEFKVYLPGTPIPYGMQPERVGDDSIWHFSMPAKEVDNISERVMNETRRFPNFAVALSSRVETPEGIRHLPMMDFMSYGTWSENCTQRRITLERMEQERLLYRMTGEMPQSTSLLLEQMLFGEFSANVHRSATKMGFPKDFIASSGDSFHAYNPGQLLTQGELCKFLEQQQRSRLADKGYLRHRLHHKYCALRLTPCTRKPHLPEYVTGELLF